MTTAQQTKTCSKCGVDKPLSDFYERKDRPTQKRQYFSQCKTCYAQRKKLWTEANQERAKATNRKCQLKAKYGITPDEYERIFSTQGGACAICGTTSPVGRGEFHVDHCHSTGKIRGLLCHHCNVGLGNFRDSTQTLTQAISYLNLHK